MYKCMDAESPALQNLSCVAAQLSNAIVSQVVTQVTRFVSFDLKQPSERIWSQDRAA